MSVSIFHMPLIFAEVKIPVIVVFTKFDLLFVEHFRDCSHITSSPDKKMEAKKRALRAFSEFTQELRFPFVPVSTRKDMQEEYGGLLIIFVTSLFPFKWLLMQERCSWN